MSSGPAFPGLMVLGLAAVGVVVLMFLLFWKRK